jgi:TolB-like protein/Tfp pilus assembly protein PilF
MEIFALANSGFPIPNPENINGKFKERKPGKSIAVLPFKNMSNDPEQEYFSDGVAEEILNSLTHLNDLKVAGRISSFQLKGKNASLKEIGETLGVKTVLEGSVRKHGSRLRITAQLINVDDGFHLWSERFDREMNDIFSIQDEIALSVTEALKLTLLRKDREIMIKNHTQNLQAYELYLKGIFYLNKRGASLLLARQYFQQAIDLDPDFALAYSGYADSNLFMATYGLAPPKQVLPKAKQSAERALQLDPLLCEPYCSLGYYYACFEWNWKDAEKNFLKSIELNPRYCHTHSWYMWTYLSLIKGRFNEAEKHCQAALKLEPLSATLYGTYSLILHTAGKLNEALAVCKAGIELDAYSFLCQVNKGIVSMELHQYEEAIASYTFVLNISRRHHFAVNGLIWNYCETGELEKARELMNELKERSEKEYIANMFTGMSAAYLNDLDQAFEYLEKAFHDRDPLLLTLRYEKWGPPNLRNDPRFQKFTDRIGFPQ